MALFDETKIPILSNALNAYTLRHKVISANIANIGTPGYKAKAVDFESTLNDQLAKGSVGTTVTNKNHFDLSSAHSTGGAAPSIVEANSDTFSEEEMKSGINDVDIDSEMAEMAKNQIRFKYVSKLLGDNFRSLQKSIRGQA
ncbi:MAG: flagellar basal body rod protein FlgB [Bacteroidota bacterium]